MSAIEKTVPRPPSSSVGPTSASAASAAPIPTEKTKFIVGIGWAADVAAGMAAHSSDVGVCGDDGGCARQDAPTVAAISWDNERKKSASTTPLVRWLPLNGTFPSRRAAADAIRAGRVSVGGAVCLRLSEPIGGGDDLGGGGEGTTTASTRVEVDGVPVVPPVLMPPPEKLGPSRGGNTVADAAEEEAGVPTKRLRPNPSSCSKHLHILLHKPKNCLTTRSNRKQVKGGGTIRDLRPTVFEYLPPIASDRHCVPVGRLDVDTTGLLLFTTDGTLNNLLANPALDVPKIYRARLRKTDEVLSVDAIRKLAEGVTLPGKHGRVVRGIARNVPGSIGTVDLIITQGYNHQVKHMLRIVGRPLLELHRLEFAGLNLDNRTPIGTCRVLDDHEAWSLYRLAKLKLERLTSDAHNGVGG